jgi:signal transduction histidine kinase
VFAHHGRGAGKILISISAEWKVGLGFANAETGWRPNDRGAFALLCSVAAFMSAFVQIKPELDTADIASEQRLSESQRMEAVGRMVSGVAHDCNNLLTGIVLCSDLLLAGLEKNSRLCRYATEIRSASAQGAGMIQQLMALARPRAVEPRLLSLNDAIAGMQNLLARLIGENIELLTELAADLKMVRIDPAQLQQIILNLVLNARDAMPDGGGISLRTRNRQAAATNASQLAPFPTSCVELEVRDTGCGMDAQTRARVFEPFFTTKTRGKGNGLGLATVYRIVEQRGGTIEIESKPGEGTRVIIRFPVGRKPANPERAETFPEAAELGAASEELIQSPMIQSGEIQKQKARKSR